MTPDLLLTGSITKHSCRVQILWRMLCIQNGVGYCCATLLSQPTQGLLASHGSLLVIIQVSCLRAMLHSSVSSAPAAFGQRLLQSLAVCPDHHKLLRIVTRTHVLCMHTSTAWQAFDHGCYESLNDKVRLLNLHAQMCCCDRAILETCFISSRRVKLWCTSPQPRVLAK